MADLYHWWQQDWTLLPDGDLFLCGGIQKTSAPVPVSATIEGEQRVLRRLLTAAGTYIWHPEYGAGLPGYVGSTPQLDALTALIMGQVLLEDCVAKDPLPSVITTPILNGVMVNITYVDNNVGRQVTVGFDINA